MGKDFEYYERILCGSPIHPDEDDSSDKGNWDLSKNGSLLKGVDSSDTNEYNSKNQDKE